MLFFSAQDINMINTAFITTTRRSIVVYIYRKFRNYPEIFFVGVHN